MTTDAEELVRDWATFGIGIAGTTDSIEVRRALKARLDDPDATTRYEAVQGLARLRDECVVPILLAGLGEDPDDGAAISLAMLYSGLDSCEPPSTAELIDRLRSDNA
jgi:HEAT repeat protein